MSRLRREQFAARYPVHVALRTVFEAGYLRGPRLYQAIEAAIRECQERFGMRVVHFSVQGHAHVLRTPTEAAYALRYVLQNFRHHLRPDVAPKGIDPCSSAIWIGQVSGDLPIRPARTWLLRNAAAPPLRKCA